MANVNTRIRDQAIDRAAMIRMAEEALQANVQNAINAHSRELERLVQTGAFTGSRRANFYRDVRASIRRTYRTAYRATRRDLIEIIRMEIKAGSNLLQKELRGVFKVRDARLNAILGIFDNSLKPVGPSTFRASSLFKEFQKIARAELPRIQGIVNRGVAERLTTPQIARNVTRTLGISRRHSETLVRTSITQSTNITALENYNANSDVLRGYQYIATLDSRTSTICSALDGRVFKLDGKGYMPKPPQHWNCRSTTIPVVKSFNVLDKDRLGNSRFIANKFRNPTPAFRASLNGEAAFKITYGNWLATQGFTVQLRHLGSRRRVELFNEGNLRLSQFSSGGRYLSLDELARINARIINDRDPATKRIRLICNSPCTTPAEKLQNRKLVDEITDPKVLATDADARDNLVTFFQVQTLGVDETEVLGLANFLGQKLNTRLRARGNARYELVDGEYVNQGARFPDVRARFRERLNTADVIKDPELRDAIYDIATRAARDEPNVEAVILRVLTDTVREAAASGKLSQSAQLTKRLLSEGKLNELLRRKIARPQKGDTDFGALFEVFDSRRGVKGIYQNLLRNNKILNENLGDVQVAQIISDAPEAYSQINNFAHAAYADRLYDGLVERLRKRQLDSTNNKSTFATDAVIDGIENNRERVTELLIESITHPGNRDGIVVASRIGNKLFKEFDPANFSVDLTPKIGNVILDHGARNNLFRLNTTEYLPKSRGAIYDTVSERPFGGKSYIVDRQIILDRDANLANTDPDLFKLKENLINHRNNKQITSIYEDIPVVVRKRGRARLDKIEYKENGDVFVNGNKLSSTLARTSGSRQPLTPKEIEVLNKASSTTFRINEDTLDITTALYNADRGYTKIKDLINERGILEVRKLINANQVRGQEFRFLARLQDNGRLHYVGPNAPTGGGISRSYLDTGVVGQINTLDKYNEQTDLWKQFIGSKTPNGKTATTRTEWANAVRDEDLDDLSELFERIRANQVAGKNNRRAIDELNDNPKFEFFRSIKTKEQTEVIRVLVEWRKLRMHVRNARGELSDTVITNSFRRKGAYETRLFLGEDGVSSGFQIQALSTRNPQLAQGVGLINETSKQSLYRKISRDIINSGRLKMLGLELKEDDLFDAIKGLQTVAVYGAGDNTIQVKIANGLKEALAKYFREAVESQKARIVSEGTIVGKVAIDEAAEKAAAGFRSVVISNKQLDMVNREFLFAIADVDRKLVRLNKELGVARTNNLADDIATIEGEIATLTRDRSMFDSFRRKVDSAIKNRESLNDILWKDLPRLTSDTRNILRDIQNIPANYYSPKTVEDIANIATDITTQSVGDWQSYIVGYGRLGKSIALNNKTGIKRRDLGSTFNNANKEDILDARVPFRTYDGETVYPDFTLNEVKSFTHDVGDIRLKQRVAIANEGIIDDGNVELGYGVLGTHSNDAVLAREFLLRSQGAATVFDEFAGNTVDIIKHRQLLREISAEFADANAVQRNLEEVRKLLPDGRVGVTPTEVQRLGLENVIKHNADNPFLDGAYSRSVDVEEYFYKLNLLPGEDGFFFRPDANGNRIKALTKEDVLNPDIDINDWYGISF